MFNLAVKSVMCCVTKTQICATTWLLVSRNVHVSSVCRSPNSNLAEFRDKQHTLIKHCKVIKIAIIGVPNSGKSTLINEILNRRICSTSSKVHTTQRKTRAIGMCGDTQLVFLDTPGLVTSKECKRHSLENSFLLDAQTSLLEADLIGVVHDLANKWTRGTLDSKVLQLLSLAPHKPSVLILNKVDTLKSKRLLLDLVQTLTSGNLRSVSAPPQPLPESKPSEGGWPNFSEVFMVSALQGHGVGDIKEYLLMQAQSGDWLFPSDMFTDQRPQELAELAVREKLMDHLPKEMPYNIKTTMEMWEKGDSGLLCIVVLAECPAKRYVKMLLGHDGARIRQIAREAEQALSNTFRCGVKLKIVVTQKQNK